MEQRRERLGNIVETLPDAKTLSRLIGLVDQQGNIFTRVVGSLEGWIVAVVGGQDQYIVAFEHGQKTFKPLIGLL